MDYRFPGADGTDAFASLGLGPGTALGIAQAPAANRPAPTDCVAVWFYVDDVDRAHDAVLGAGGSSRSAPTDVPWGERVAQVRDPDGNLVHLAAEPS